MTEVDSIDFAYNDNLINCCYKFECIFI